MISAPSTITQSNSLTFRDFEIDLSPDGLEKEKIIGIFEVLFDIPEFIELVADATSEHPYQVKFVPGNRLYSHGECDYWNKIINISFHCETRLQITTIIFELCNAANKELRNYLDSSSLTLDSSENEYALAAEQYEFLSTKRYTELFRCIGKNPKLRQVLDDFFSDSSLFEEEVKYYDFITFNEYWNTANTHDPQLTQWGYSHAEYYRLIYRNSRKKRIGDNLAWGAGVFNCFLFLCLSYSGLNIFNLFCIITLCTCALVAASNQIIDKCYNLLFNNATSPFNKSSSMHELSVNSPCFDSELTSIPLSNGPVIFSQLHSSLPLSNPYEPIEAQESLEVTSTSTKPNFVRIKL